MTKRVDLTGSVNGVMLPVHYFYEVKEEWAKSQFIWRKSKRLVRILMPRREHEDMMNYIKQECSRMKMNCYFQAANTKTLQDFTSLCDDEIYLVPPEAMEGYIHRYKVFVPSLENITDKNYNQIDKMLTEQALRVTSR